MHGISFPCRHQLSAAAAAEQNEKRDNNDPNAFVVKKIAKTVIHDFSLSPPHKALQAVGGGKTAAAFAAMYAAESFSL